MVLPAPLGPSSATRSPVCDRQVDAEEGLVPVGVGVGEAGHLEARSAHRAPIQAAISTTSAASGSRAAASHWAGAAETSESLGMLPV